ncbi:MAG TPA: hypothetical protein VMV78_01270 [Thiobacillus sp.]|nr:hypothetical protein [Thiobacillus sp.]
MVDTPGGGQAQKPVAPGVGAGNQGTGGAGDPTRITAPAAPSPGSGTPSPDAGSQNAQPVQSIRIGNNVFTTADIEAVIKAKMGLDATNKDLKTKLDAAEAKDLSDKEKAEKENVTLKEENLKLKAANLNAKIQRKLDEKGVKFTAEAWNHGITEESQIDEAVQKLIKENPGIVKAAGPAAPGTVTPPVGSAPPVETPGAGNFEAELMQKYAKAQTPAEIAALDKQLYDLRGQKPPGGEQPI